MPKPATTTGRRDSGSLRFGEPVRNGAGRRGVVILLANLRRLGADEEMLRAAAQPRATGRPRRR